jgi:ubiquitin carboxyl-terminal hydrolase 31
LGDGDAWFCPQCKRKQEVVKRMGLWSLPDVLILHLKRFRQMANSNASNKLSTLVEFPLENCDMSPFVTKSNNSNSNSESANTKNNVDIVVVENNAANIVNNSEQNNSSSKDLISNNKVVETITPAITEISSNNNSTTNTVWTNVLSTFKKDKQQPTIESIQHQPPNKAALQTTNECFVYDLYAVCNHHGDDLQGGHYTATCRNPTDGQWYSFDDIHTSKVEENEVVSQDAYILFYQRQSLTSNPSSSSASSSSSSGSSSISGGSGQEHWVYRMPDFNYKNKTSSSNSTSTTTTQTNSTTSTLTKAQQQANVRAATQGGGGTAGTGFSRNKGSYATMPIVKSESSVEVKNNSTTTASTNELQRQQQQPVTKNEADNVIAASKAESESNNAAAETKSLTAITTTTTSSTSNNPGEKKTNLQEQISSDQTEEIDDVSRPIDKNDVD